MTTNEGICREGFHFETTTGSTHISSTQPHLSAYSLLTSYFCMETYVEKPGAAITMVEPASGWTDGLWRNTCICTQQFLKVHYIMMCGHKCMCNTFIKPKQNNMCNKSQSNLITEITAVNVSNKYI